MKRSEVVFNVALVFIDLAMILLGFVLAWEFRYRASDFVPVKWMLSLREYLRYIVLFLPVWLGVFAVLGLYAFKGISNLAKELMMVILAVSATLSLMIIIIFFNRDQFFSRLIIIYAWLFVSVMVVAGRLGLRMLQRSFYRYGWGVRRVVVVGSNNVAKELIKYLHENRNLGLELVGIIDEKKQKGEKIEGYRVMGDSQWLAKINKRYCLDEVWMAEANKNDEYMLDTIAFCQEKDLVFRFVPSLLEMLSANIETQTLAGMPLIAVRETALEGWGRIIKRVFDIVFSLLVVLVLWPIFLVVAVAIKIDSNGPVFYKSTRIGKKGKSFILYKFRSMKVEYSVGEEYGGKKAEKIRDQLKKYNIADGPLFKIDNDPRITRVGKFIRKTRIDEFGQIINVLKGDMSWIGPRPPLAEEVKQYKPHQMKRLAIKSGITGPWQVTGRHDLTFDEIVKLDTYYIEHWTLLLDFQIFFKTILLMFSGSGK